MTGFTIVIPFRKRNNIFCSQWKERIIFNFSKTKNTNLYSCVITRGRHVVLVSGDYRGVNFLSTNIFKYSQQRFADWQINICTWNYFWSPTLVINICREKKFWPATLQDSASTNVFKLVLYLITLLEFRWILTILTRKHGLLASFKTRKVCFLTTNPSHNEFLSHKSEN